SNVSILRAMMWCRARFDETEFEIAARRKKDDLLIHFALGAFSGSRAFNTLPPTLRRDVRHLFGSFRSVQAEARRVLFSLHGSFRRCRVRPAAAASFGELRVSDRRISRAS